MANTSLDTIRTKVRRLTRSPSSAQISDAEIDQYINTFVLYDFPESLRLFNLRTTFTFYCNPFQDEYPTAIGAFGGAPGASNNPLYDFNNRYISIHPPVYIAGYQSFYSQSREQFFGIYPRITNIESVGSVGDGVTTQFSGDLLDSDNAALLKNNVLFSSVDAAGNALAMVDVPALDAVTGNPTVWGSLVQVTTPLASPVLLSTYATTPPAGMNPANYINYATGQFVVTFPSAPGSGEAINSQTVPLVTGLPQALLFYDGKFVVRPIPDQPYAINFEAYVRPTELLGANQNPELNEWWQYISFQASKKIFEDKLDMDSVALIMPALKEQENMIQRRTIEQYRNDRAATIYTEQTGKSYGAGWFYGGGSF